MASAIEHIDQEEDEMLLVIVTNTVVNPRTMMIHSCNASLADGAVMRVRWLDTVTLLAFL